MLTAGSADLGCVAEEEQLGDGPCEAGAAGEEPRDPNLGIIRFKAHKLMGAQLHGFEFSSDHSLDPLCAQRICLFMRQMRQLR